MRDPRKEQIFLISYNLSGLLLYLFFAAILWPPPGQSDIAWGFGEGLTWTFTAMPWLVVCTAINCLMLPTICARLILNGRWHSMLILAMFLAMWAAAFELDLSHH